MNPSLHARLYHLDVADTDWSLAHIYEHLLLASVEDILTKNGHNTFTYGWTSGNTFRTDMFIEAAFYSEESAKLFDDFMTAPNREINFNHFDAVIASIEAEEAVMATLLDRDGVIKDIAKLATRPFVDVEDIDGVRYIEPPKETVIDQRMRMKHSPRSFREFSVTLYLPQSTFENYALFLRLSPVLFQVIERSVRSIGGYAIGNDTTPAYNRNRDAAYEINRYRISKKHFKAQDTQKIIEDALLNFSRQDWGQELERYALTFPAVPTWYSFPVDYYRSTGILASRHAIARLLNRDRVKHIIDSVRIELN